MGDGQRWTRFLSRFSFGFVLGSGMGYLLGARAGEMGITTIPSGWLFALTIPGCGILFGLIAWWFSDDFWDV
jgi:hypothetical protein